MTAMEYDGKTWNIVGRDRMRSGWVTYLMRTSEDGQIEKASIFAPNRRHDSQPPEHNIGPNSGRDRSGRIRR